jgi:phosphoglycerate-specific signal transduction histidine kinase
MGKLRSLSMFLATVFSALYFLTSPAVVPSSIEVIRQHHLETVEGRVQFLTDQLSPYAAAAGQLNHEIEQLADTIKALSPEKDQEKIVSLTNEMLQKMSRLTAMMSVLNLAATIEQDFQQIDAVLHQTEPLTPAQLELIDRLASLCRSVGTTV